MTPELVAFTLVMLGMQVFLMRQIQKLIDKVMSRNYAEYQQSKPTAVIHQAKTNGIAQEQSLDPDMGVLSDFMS